MVLPGGRLQSRPIFIVGSPERSPSRKCHSAIEYRSRWVSLSPGVAGKSFPGVVANMRFGIAGKASFEIATAVVVGTA